jgi:hypothetical protein
MAWRIGAGKLAARAANWLRDAGCRAISRTPRANANGGARATCAPAPFAAHRAVASRVLPAGEHRFGASAAVLDEGRRGRQIPLSSVLAKQGSKRVEGREESTGDLHLASRRLADDSITI